MEKILELLFDYLRFESNTELKHAIDSVRSRREAVCRTGKTLRRVERPKTKKP